MYRAIHIKSTSKTLSTGAVDGGGASAGARLQGCTDTGEGPAGARQRSTRRTDTRGRRGPRRHRGAPLCFPIVLGFSALVKKLRRCWEAAPVKPGMTVSMRRCTERSMPHMRSSRVNSSFCRSASRAHSGKGVPSTPEQKSIGSKRNVLPMPLLLLHTYTFLSPGFRHSDLEEDGRPSHSHVILEPNGWRAGGDGG